MKDAEEPQPIRDFFAEDSLRYPDDDAGEMALPMSFLVVVGVYRGHKDFVHQAMKASHPTDMGLLVPPELVNPAQHLFSRSPSDSIKAQLIDIKELTKLVHDHAQEDSRILSQMDPLTR